MASEQAIVFFAAFAWLFYRFFAEEEAAGAAASAEAAAPGDGATAAKR